MKHSPKLKHLDKNILKKYKSMETFNMLTASLIALLGGGCLTGVMLWGKIDTSTLLIDPDFHWVLVLSINIAVSFVLYAYNFQIIKSRLAVGIRIILIIFGSLIIATSFTILFSFLSQWIYGGENVERTISIYAIKDVVLAFIYILLTILIFSINRRHQQMLKMEQIQSENLMIRYDALQKQLDPHFLFNSLNTLSSLIGIDDNKATIYLQHLASTYRYITRDNKITTLAEEMEFAQSYICMMQIRYGNSLTIFKSVPTEYLSHYVVHISLQLLIENVIKHNVISERHPLTITIEYTHRNTLRVSNPIQSKKSIELSNNPQELSVGLVNLNKRYWVLFHQHISIIPSDEVFAVELPLIPPEQAEVILGTLEQQTSLPDNNTLYTI